MSRLNRIGIGSGGTPRAILVFACAAHFMHHVLVSLYLTLVLTLTGEWRMSYGDLIALWTLGSLLVGLGAPLAGWLGDRWGESRVMVLLFFGLGGAAILCGMAQGPASMTAALAVLGAFGALYHPVGNSWVVKHAIERGKAIALAGISGSFGVAAGPVVAGVLNDTIDWRWAFILPGIVTIGFGAALVALKRAGRVPEREGDAHVALASTHTARERRNVLGLLALTMTLTLIAVTAFMTALPKLVEGVAIVSSDGLIGVGLVTGAIYLLASGAQFVGGHFADRGAARRTYLFLFVLLAAVFLAAGLTANWVILPLAVAVMFLFEAIAPIETVFVARFAPADKRGLFFGMRYAISVVGGPVGVWIVAALYDPVDRFAWLLYVLAAGAIVTAALSLALPRDREALAFGGAK
jgi:MFS transporter, FSR family, fosmidomycin resistance protein